ncbi:MAG: TlpA family protein disulfide reductase [Acidobacteria bacterium]|nr:TlpA family protein disulfide reductase [Acidobacteriota bacterium]
MKKTRSIFAILAAAMVFSLTATAQTSLTSTTGSKVDIEGQKGKVVVLAIGASWLPLSGKQAEYTNALAKKYAGKNVLIYFVATDSTSAKSKNFASNDDLTAFATKNKLTVPILRDSDGAATLKKFEVDQVPSFVVLDKNGKISGSPFGGIDPKFDVTVPISKEIDKLL